MPGIKKDVQWVRLLLCSILDHFGLRIWDPSCVMRIMRGLQSLKLFASGPNPCEVSRVKTPPNSFESNDAYHLPGSFWQAPHVFSQNTWRMPPTLEDRDQGYNPGGSVWINHRSSGSRKGQELAGSRLSFKIGCFRVLNQLFQSEVSRSKSPCLCILFFHGFPNRFVTLESHPCHEERR